VLNPTATHWGISSGRFPDGTRDWTGNSFGPFCREDDEMWWRSRPHREPHLGWALTVEEAWRRWEEWMDRQARGLEQAAARYRADIQRAREARGLVSTAAPSEGQGAAS
jgi:hypothetical protein